MILELLTWRSGEFASCGVHCEVEGKFVKKCNSPDSQRATESSNWRQLPAKRSKLFGKNAERHSLAETLYHREVFLLQPFRWPFSDCAKQAYKARSHRSPKSQHKVPHSEESADCQTSEERWWCDNWGGCVGRDLLIEDYLSDFDSSRESSGQVEWSSNEEESDVIQLLELESKAEHTINRTSQQKESEFTDFYSKTNTNEVQSAANEAHGSRDNRIIEIQTSIGRS